MKRSLKAGGGMNPKKLNQVTGKWGERLGEDYIKKCGYEIVERNVRSPFGEIDLIAEDQGTLVFIEIKTRLNDSFGFAEEAVDERKKNQLVRLASWYLTRFPKANPRIRFDVLAVQKEGPHCNIRLIQNALDL